MSKFKEYLEATKEIAGFSTSKLSEGEGYVIKIIGSTNKKFKYSMKIKDGYLFYFYSKEEFLNAKKELNL